MSRLRLQSINELIDFANFYCLSALSQKGSDADALTGDAGFRRYFRLNSLPSMILVNSPPDKEKNLEFVQVNQLLRQLNVPVPKVHAVNFAKGFLALQDLGNRSLDQEVTMNNVDALYTQGLEILTRIQACETKPDGMPTYTRNVLISEMQLFTEWFLPELLQYQISKSERLMIDRVFKLLADSALEQPQVLVHRDYHCRNLMVENKDLYVIDFQDAIWGPITYDLVSLLRDGYLRLPSEVVDHFLKKFFQTIYSELEQAIDFNQFRRWFDLMGLQRHLKVLGIFSRLSLRDDKHRYLNDLPTVMRYLLEVMAQYDELAEFEGWFRSRLLPIAAEQAWYADWRVAGISVSSLSEEP